MLFLAVKQYWNDHTTLIGHFVCHAVLQSTSYHGCMWGAEPGSEGFCQILNTLTRGHVLLLPFIPQWDARCCFPLGSCSLEHVQFFKKSGFQCPASTDVYITHFVRVLRSWGVTYFIWKLFTAQYRVFCFTWTGCQK